MHGACVPAFQDADEPDDQRDRYRDLQHGDAVPKNCVMRARTSATLSGAIQSTPLLAPASTIATIGSTMTARATALVRALSRSLAFRMPTEQGDEQRDDDERREPMGIYRHGREAREDPPVPGRCRFDRTQERPHGENDEQDGQRISARIAGVRQQKSTRREYGTRSPRGGRRHEATSTRMERHHRRSRCEERQRTQHELTRPERPDPHERDSVIQRRATISSRSAENVHQVAEAVAADRPGRRLVVREARPPQVPNTRDRDGEDERDDPPPLREPTMIPEASSGRGRRSGRARAARRTPPRSSSRALATLAPPRGQHHPAKPGSVQEVVSLAAVSGSTLVHGRRNLREAEPTHRRADQQLGSLKLGLAEVDRSRDLDPHGSQTEGGIGDPLADEQPQQHARRRPPRAYRKVSPR